MFFESSLHNLKRLGYYVATKFSALRHALQAYEDPR